ncbi:hypothetical protein [Pseudomonas sp. 25 R 14]|nr:hypothetical protein [Pseudomonas sp. 25 R 14]CRM75082.1 hypothetical protein [Pseudomonas sp. 25 R 14]
MLDRAGDTDRDVQLWRNDLAGLADLHVVGYEACVDRRARSADRRAQLVGQGVQVLEVVTVLHATTAGNDDLGSGQLRAVRLGQFFANKAGSASIVHSRNGFNGSRTPFRDNRVEAGGAYGDDFDGSCRLHGGNGVTGVDRALEGVGAFHRNDLGDLVDVQLRGNAWQDVFAVGGSGSQDVAVGSAKLCNQRRDVFRQLVRVGSVVSQQYFAHASYFCCGFSHGASALTGDQYVDVATDFGGGSNGVQGGRGQHLVIVFGDYEDSHDQITFASFFSFSTSSATDLTLIPALRAAGASTLTVLLVEAVETPKASGVSTSRGFFLAFMMFGRDA